VSNAEGDQLPWLIAIAKVHASAKNALVIERPLIRLLCGDRQERVGLRCKIAQEPDHEYVLAERDPGRHY